MRVIVPKVFCAGLILAASFALVFLRADCRAAEAKTADKKANLTEKIAKSESPIRIAADRMEVLEQERNIVFEGHVIVQQDDLTLTGNRLKVTALPGGKGDGAAPTDKIDYIEAEGNVTVSQKDRFARADRAIFYQREQKIVLHGHPVVAQGKDKIEGSLITIYLQQGRSVVEGGKETPVQAVLFPGKKE